MADQAAAANQSSADHVGEEASDYFRRILRRMVECGHELVEQVVVEAKADTQHTRPAAEAYAQVTGSMRRSMMLHERLDQTKKTASPRQRVAARKRIIRAVEDAIDSEAHGEDREALHGELLERLDRPDLDAEIAERPVGEIVTDITHDLGLTGLYADHPWKRRIPHDIAILNARAEQLPGAGPSEKLLALLAAAPPRPTATAPPPNPYAGMDMATLLAERRRYEAS